MAPWFAELVRQLMLHLKDDKCEMYARQKMRKMTYFYKRGKYLVNRRSIETEVTLQTYLER